MGKTRTMRGGEERVSSSDGELSDENENGNNDGEDDWDDEASDIHISEFLALNRVTAAEEKASGSETGKTETTKEAQKETDAPGIVKPTWGWGKV